MATQLTALQEAIFQNTPGNSQGLPEGFGIEGKYGTTTLTPAPSGFSSLTGWGVVYQEAGASVSPNAATDTVQIADYTTYVHLTNGSWVEVQNEAKGGIGGAHYVANFANNASIPLKQQTLSDGSVSMDAPPAIDRLSALFGLSPFERDILLLTAGTEMDSALAAQCAGPVTFGLALAKLAEPHWGALTPSGPLRRCSTLCTQVRYTG